jgi:hypothetical protein
MIEIRIHNTGSKVVDTVQELPGVTSRLGGHGLGLTIVQKNMAEMGGSFSLENTPSGVMATLLFPKSMERELLIEKNLWTPWPANTSSIKVYVSEHSLEPVTTVKGTTPAAFK